MFHVERLGFGGVLDRGPLGKSRRGSRKCAVSKGRSITPSSRNKGDYGREPERRGGQDDHSREPGRGPSPS